MKLVQYVGISIIVICLLILGGVYVQQTFFPFERGAKTVGVEKEEDNAQVSGEKSNSAYIYALSDEKVLQAIEAGKKGDFEDFFNIPVQSSTIENGIVEKVTINTPFRMIARHSGVVFREQGRTISLEEAKKAYDSLIEKTLIFDVLFKEDTKSLYTVKMYQNGNLIGDGDIGEDSKDSWKDIYVLLDKIDFTKPATITITDKRDSAKTAEYEVVFSDYIR